MTSPRIIIHLGAAKTGSSAIQAFLRVNSKVLLEHGVIVPDKSLDLSNDITGEHVWAFQQLIERGSAEELSAKMLRLVKKLSANQKLVISAENLSNSGSHRLFSELARVMAIRGVVYIRRQDEVLTSAWQQWHCKLESDLNAWIVKALRTRGHWDRLLADWESVLGEGAVDVRVFDRRAFPNNNICEDFLTVLGMSEQKTKFKLDVGDVNSSISDALIPIVAGDRTLFGGAHDNQFYNVVQRLLGEDNRNSGRVSLITPAQRDAICYYYKDINQRVCAKYFPGRRALFDAVDHGKYRYLEEESLRTEQLRQILHMIYALAKKGDIVR